jgi:hypothetical protein
MKKFIFRQIFKKSPIYLFCALLLLSVFSCNIINRILGVITTLGNSIVNVNSVLDNTMNNLSATATNYQSIMEEAIQSIKDINVKQQLQSALDNAIVTASGEIKCDIQFTADYLIKRIQAIKAEYNHQPVPILAPRICTVLPSLIDMNLPANQRNYVQITGYFLNDNFSKYKLYHVRSGANIDMTYCLTSNTDFKLQINLGSNGITLDQNSQKLVLMWDNDIVTEIPVIQRQAVPCQLRSRILTNLPQMTLLPVKKAFPGLNKSEGDAEFDGNGPCTTGNVSIFTRNNGTELWARAFVRMWECPDDFKYVHSDYSYGDITFEEKLITVDYGWRIKIINQSTYENFQNIDQICDITELVTGNGVVANYVILGDTGGDDLGKSKVVITFRPVNVTLEEIGDCIRN